MQIIKFIFYKNKRIKKAESCQISNKIYHEISNAV